MESVEKLYDQMLESVLKYNPQADTALIRKAFEYADVKHASQKRKDGSPYVTHPMAVAEIVAEMGLDTESILAAILHDCIEDTDATFEDISKKFGQNVAELVEAVTKLTRVTYTSQEEEQMENLRKMFMAMAKDIRVILIKIADRLHNMRTMDYQTEVKQKTKSLETMEIYAPLAHRLGMQKIKWELEDTALRYLDPVGYQEITDALASRQEVFDQFLNNIIGIISRRLDEVGIKATVYGRIKHIYSIYRKMFNQNKSLYDVYDLYAFRVIVDDIADCYNVLGHVHDLFKLVPGRFKDYISTPKPNMYQSLHTTVIGSDGIPFEVQIRTWDMHHTAEYGIAAHWKYKQNLNGHLGTEEKLEWVRRLLESQQDTEAEDFIHTLKIDMFDDEVFVFTPQGEVINLPNGSTPIDFAYAIHSEVGNHMVGAKVNNRIVTFDHALENGNIVEIITSNSAKGPSRDWSKICKSNQAKNKIKQWFKRERRDENVAHGKSSFESELRRAGVSMADITDDEVLPLILKKVSFNTLDDMYAAIGYAGLTATKAVNRIRDELLRINKIQTAKADPEQTITITAKTDGKKSRQSEKGIIVEGIDNCLIKFAKCCTPVPGDDIVGFITKGFGVSIHRKDCQNVKGSDDPAEAGRWVRVAWADTSTDSFRTSLEITAKDRNGLVMDVAAVLTAMKLKVYELSARGFPDGSSLVSLTIEVKDSGELDSVRARLGRVSGVSEVRRIRG